MQIIGCDVAKATFDIKLADHKNRSFSNRRGGFSALLKWINRVFDEEVCVVLEATGVYHLPLAAFLTDAGINVLVTNPGRARAFAKSQNRKINSTRATRWTPFHCVDMVNHSI